MKPTYFADPAALRAWFEAQHESERELLVGYYKVGSGKASVTWPQSVDEALCFGWIDGLRRGIDEHTYAIRFTPRKPTSVWSSVNVKRFGELERQGLVRAMGRAAFEQKSAARSGIYGHEQARKVLDPGVAKAVRADARAWNFFSAQTPSYQRLCGHWVVTAKRAETRERRLAMLIACCRKGVFIPGSIWSKAKPKPSR